MACAKRAARSFVCVVLGGTLTCLASACTTATAAHEVNEPAISQIAASADVRTLALPLDAYVLNGQQHRLVNRAISVLAVECLARFGYQVEVPVLADLARDGHEGKYGLTDLAAAQEFGYHPSSADRGAKQKEPVMPAGAYAVMHGEVKASAGQQVPAGGCLGEATARVNDVDQGLAARGIALTNKAAADAQRDSRVVAAFTAWSECMKAQGHQYRDPWQANDDPRWQGSPAATPAETQTAVADVTCKNTTNLLGIWITVETAYQQRALESNSAVLAELKAAIEATTRNATSVLAGKR
jgi:hypothetical protein